MTVIKFGTDGWRDLMYDRFNLPNVRRCVLAIAKYVADHRGQDRGIVVGFDARFFSDFFAREAAAILMAKGIKVFLGERDFPTPVVAFAVKHYGAYGAVMFTASHNPPEYNGIKFIPEYAGPASLEITKEIENNLTALGETPVDGSAVALRDIEGNPLLMKVDPTREYLEQLRRLVRVDEIAKAGLKIFVDPMYASGRGFIPSLLAECQVQEIRNRRDPLFGGFLPDPQGKLLGELGAAVKSQPDSIGLATDGDADRFGIIDSDGTYLTPNQVITLLLYYLIHVRGYQGKAVRSVATTHMIDRLGAQFGVETIETPVGFKYIGEMMRTEPVIIGGEESGGLSILGHLPEKDGILACALMAEVRAVTGKPLMETLKELYGKVGYFYTHRLDIHLSDEAKQIILQRCKGNPPEKVGAVKVTDLKTIDGFKFLLENGGWFLIRPSGTESLIRVYIEANGQSELEQLVADVRQLVDEWGRTA